MRLMEPGTDPGAEAPMDDEPAVGALPSPLADSTTALVGRAASRVRKVMQDVMPASAKALPRDYAILSALADSDAFSQADLAARLNINRTVMVKLVDRLEAVGYVVRVRNTADRRSYTLSLTGQGRLAQEVMGPAIDRGEAELNAPLLPYQRRRLNDLVRRLLPDLDESLPHPPRQRTGYLIVQADLRLRRRTDQALASLGLQVRHFAVLAVLAGIQPCPQQQLARRLGMTETGIVPVIDDLQALDLVQRSRDPRDRRRYALTLRDQGRRKLAAAADAAETVRAEIVRTLGSDAEEELRTLLQALVTATPPAPHPAPAHHP
jgi:DNA-binding MarR family transcriptional regulator